MKIATAIKHLRSLHEAEVETGNLKEAVAIEVAIAHLTSARAKELIAAAVAKTKADVAKPICRACAERARGWEPWPRWVTLHGWEHRVPKRHRSTLCGMKLEKEKVKPWR